ncbi:hypothetical protein BP6252_12394 [Coleophoma cylindrospora]|uniref:Uncharacterized protein n=1 Tax=Coleophoma cylindrospora TaxID=1849047 RepID=A0A3D8QH08_9HELO|nr:hypothetical protein BP6252_12394 [Coleophoma cylindrospora]
MLHFVGSRRLCINCRKEKRADMRSQLKDPSDPDYSVRATIQWMRDWDSLEMAFQRQRARTESAAWSVINTAIAAAQKEGAVGLFDEEVFRQIEKEQFGNLQNATEGAWF